MNRTEFLAALALRLDDLPEDERDEAVKYYSEYLDEVGADKEDGAIAELGGAEKVANIIRANCGYGPRKTAPEAPKPALTLEGPGWQEAEKAQAAVKPAPAQAQADAAQNAQAAAQQDGGEAAPAYTPPSSSTYHYESCAAKPADGFNSPTNILLVVLLIAAAVFVLPTLFGLVCGAFGALAGIVGGGVRLAVSAVGVLVGGIGLLSGSLAAGLATIGAALLALGAGILVGALGVYLIVKCVPLLWKALTTFCKFVAGKVRGTR